MQSKRNAFDQQWWAEARLQRIKPAAGRRATAETSARKGHNAVRDAINLVMAENAGVRSSDKRAAQIQRQATRPL